MTKSVTFVTQAPSLAMKDLGRFRCEQSYQTTVICISQSSQPVEKVLVELMKS